jgi:hypothetical protein
MILRALRNGGSWVGLALVLGGLACGCAGALRENPGAGLGVPRALEGDVAAGYRAYEATLERWGRWTEDPLYAVRWCPQVNPATFAPYRSDGHWAPSAGDATGWGAPPGAPFWVSDDAETWGTITMHHGWWIHVEEGAPEGAWCWIPGVAETAGRVVWRTGDGFVGWAPELPFASEDDDDEDLSWSYELLGTLFDDAVDLALLTDDALEDAREATRARHDADHPGRPRQVGPSHDQVAAARKALSGYVLAHPEVSPVVARAHAASAPNPNATSTSTTTSKSFHATESDSPLPPSMALYDQMMRDPMPGPGGMAPSPYLPFAASRASGRMGASWSRGSSFTTAPASSARSSSSSGSSSRHHGSGHSSSSRSSGSSSGKSHGK